MKLGNNVCHGARHGARHIFPVAVVLAAGLGGCASTPTEAVREKLDPDTATTVTVMARPVELLSETPRATAGDAFAYMAPFETNRMGERALFLWVTAPQNAGPVTTPQVLCNGQPVGLQPLNGDLTQLSLSRPPYEMPAPWSTQWYFRLPQDALKCFATAQGISLQTRASKGEQERFTADGKNLASLEAFSRR